MIDRRSRVKEKNAFGVSHHYGVHLYSSYLMQNFKPFQGK